MKLSIDADWRKAEGSFGEIQFRNLGKIFPPDLDSEEFSLEFWRKKLSWLKRLIIRESSFAILAERVAISQLGAQKIIYLIPLYMFKIVKGDVDRRKSAGKSTKIGLNFEKNWCLQSLADTVFYISVARYSTQSIL